MDPDVVVSTRPFRNVGMSKAALTHRMRKLRTPAKCRECDSYVYFQGAECEEVSPAFIAGSDSENVVNGAENCTVMQHEI